MKVNRQKLELAMARACMNTEDLAKASQLPCPTLNNAIVGKGVRPGTIGKIARALCCDPVDILEGGN